MAHITINMRERNFQIGGSYKNMLKYPLTLYLTFGNSQIFLNILQIPLNKSLNILQNILKKS